MEFLPLQYCFGVFSVPEIGYFIVFSAVTAMIIMLFRR